MEFKGFCIFYTLSIVSNARMTALFHRAIPFLRWVENIFKKMKIIILFQLLGVIHKFNFDIRNRIFESIGTDLIYFLKSLVVEEVFALPKYV